MKINEMNERMKWMRCMKLNKISGNEWNEWRWVYLNTFKHWKLNWSCQMRRGNRLSRSCNFWTLQTCLLENDFKCYFVIHKKIIMSFLFFYTIFGSLCICMASFSLGIYMNHIISRGKEENKKNGYRTQLFLA